MKYVLGLDVGIGSTGWAVIRNDDKKRIEDFGVRIYESGETNRGKDRYSQERRRFRASRRLVRRRHHRKARIKAHLQNIGLISVSDIEKYFETAKSNILETRVRGLDEKLTPEEIAACLINICNRRGYKDFYEVDEETLSNEEKKQYESERKGAELVSDIMKKGGYRSAAEMFLLDKAFNTPRGRKYRNKSGSDTTYLVSRKILENEVLAILHNQSRYYPCLTEQNINTAVKIIFAQRCFEDGPGNASDKFRKYTGFLDSLGKCRFYKDEDRSSRFTVLSDLYAVVNALSQYRYIKGNEMILPREMAEELLDITLKNAQLTKNDVKRVAKKYGFTVNMKTDSNADDLNKCIKYIKPLKQIMTECGDNWDKLVSVDYTDFEDNLLNSIGVILSKYHTPSRRMAELKKLSGLTDKLISRLALQRFSGTSSVSYRYMKDSIEAFLSGETYGNFQARINKLVEKSDNSASSENYKLPDFESQKKDFEFYKNPVVMRAINETRKIVNAIIDKYGSPSAINIEVGSELNKCYIDREADIKRNRENEKLREISKQKIAELLNTEKSEVTSSMIERYQLGEQQSWKCLYSDREIDMKECLSKNNRSYEVDHIIPYSLILDNTLNNKALVLSSENQLKKQRTPLMYLTEPRRSEFISRVNHYYKEGKISKRKYQYLLTPSLDDSDLFEEWKSRNLNDTRYIAKFLVNYLKNNLKFAPREQGEPYREKVYAVKSAITSRLRRQWLNKDTWGTEDKDKLKEITYLDHAADAVVIANCLPAYVEIAMENLKLRDMLKRSGHVKTDEYMNSLNACADKISFFYKLDRGTVVKKLEYTDKTPSLIEDLRNEVDIRFIDPDIFRVWEERKAEQKKRKPISYTDEEIIQKFRELVTDYYRDDPDFAKSLRMPLTSYKQNKKFSGAVTTNNPVSIKQIDGKEYQLTRKSVASLKASQLEKVYTDDSDLISSLKKLFDGWPDNMTAGEILNKQSKKDFVTEKGNIIHTVTLFAPAERYIVKRISDTNYTALPNGEYYCVEFYKDKSGKLKLRGIMFSDLVKKYGKLWLKADHQYPADYGSHIMYLQKNEYFEVIDSKGKVKEKSGYFVNVFNINKGALRTARFNTPCNTGKCVSISKEDSVRKIDIDILGYRGGVIKCGEPLLSLKEKK